MKKKMHKYVLLSLSMAMAIILASCTKESDLPGEDAQRVEEAEEHPAGHAVTISAGLPAETKVAHELAGTSIHPTWETEDQVTVTFTKEGVEVTETFTLNGGAGTQSATFWNGDSQLSAGMPFTVDYVDRRNPSGWSEQKGTLEDLPECLSARVGDLSEPAELVPSLTYFHVVASIPSGVTYPYAYLNRLEGGFTMYSKPGTKGAVTVKPAEGFSGSVDFYIAVKLDGVTSSNGTDSFGSTVASRFQICFGNGVQGIAADGQAIDPAGASYKYSWTPKKDYEAGKVYRIADKTFTAFTAAQAMPR